MLVGLTVPETARIAMLSCINELDMSTYSPHGHTLLLAWGWDQDDLRRSISGLVAIAKMQYRWHMVFAATTAAD